ncbi:MAG: hypothetical protein SWY16_03095 [Cyanobacteriota bacterium]|nr:hypothetical protein [Cyanobacteriota bacterium]
MSNSESDGNALPAPDKTKSPSVPLSVYRELAAELQATQAMLDSLHVQNKQLTGQNKQLSDRNGQLRLEIANTIESVDRMRQVANLEELSDGTAGEASISELEIPSAPPLKRTPNRAEGALFPQNVTEQPASPPPIWGTPEGHIDRKWSIAVVVAIVMAAFGAGYWYQVSVGNR